MLQETEFWKREHERVAERNAKIVKSEKEVLQEVAPTFHSGSNYVEIVDMIGKTIRVYTHRDHGSRFRELADEFCKKHKFIYFTKNPVKKEY